MYWLWRCDAGHRATKFPTKFFALRAALCLWRSAWAFGVMGQPHLATLDQKKGELPMPQRGPPRLRLDRVPSGDACHLAMADSAASVTLWRCDAGRRVILWSASGSVGSRAAPSKAEGSRPAPSRCARSSIRNTHKPQNPKTPCYDWLVSRLSPWQGPL
jgi:hypothetical protein